MIAKKIPKQAEVADDYDRLALYIAAADHPGEKLKDFWLGNFDAGTGKDDLDAALAEVTAVRAMRPHIKGKTYHLIVSFRPGEEDRLKAPDLRKIAAEYVEALGFDGHQYVAGAHENTNHSHIHIAINRVNPASGKVHAPYKDFQALERASRKLEQEFGLSVDRGMSDREGDRNPLSPEARDFERHTWQQSFQRYLQEHQAEIRAGADRSKSWPQLHAALAPLGVGIKRRGNGLVFHDLAGKETMKASSLGRALSKQALEAKFGPYLAPANRPGHDNNAPPPPTRRYQRPPLLPRHPHTAPLWRRYMGTQRQPWTKATIIGRAVRNWKFWLATEAYEDPLAMVLMIAHMELLRSALGDPNSRRPAERPRQVPRTVAPALASLLSIGAGKLLPARRAAQIKAAPDRMQDAAGNTVSLVRDEESQVVGLLVVRADGKAVALGPDDEGMRVSRERDQGPAIEL